MDCFDICQKIIVPMQSADHAHIISLCEEGIERVKMKCKDFYLIYLLQELSRMINKILDPEDK